jgi:hypothetical protein
VWSTLVEGRLALHRWQNRVRSLREKAQGCSRNVEAGIKKEKHELKAEYDKLDILSESRTLTPQEREHMCSVNASLGKILDMEEVKARQRSRERNIKEGDRNTRFFHAVANQRKRKTSIHSIEGPRGTTDTTEKIIEVATQYYKDLFKFEPRLNMNILDSFFSKGEKLTPEESEILEDRFTEEEIKNVVLSLTQMEHLALMGCLLCFIKLSGEEVKDDIVEMFEDFHRCELDIYRLNFALITVIPQEKDARTMNKFRPISLLNFCYKIFTRVLTNRLGKVIDKLIASNQTTFIKGRYILESVVIAHEVLHSVHQARKQSLVLKVDYEKAYDKVNWLFLMEILEKRGIGGKWLEWIRRIIFRGYVGLTINNVEGEFFQTGKGLRQGDPLSPLAFYLSGRCVV